MSTASERAYAHIQKCILSGEFEPGSLISEHALAKTLQMSRTPVGDALQQLVYEGLVVQVSRYGTMVRPIERRDLIETYEMRETLESFAAAKAAERMRKPQIEQLQLLCKLMREICDLAHAEGDEEIEGEQLHRFLAIDMAFHLYILEAAGNQQLVKVVQNMRTLWRIFHVHRQRHSVEVVQRACLFHEEIVAALAERNADKARQAMQAHLAAGCREAIASFDQPQENVGRPLPVELQLPADVEQQLAATRRGKGSVAPAVPASDKPARPQTSKKKPPAKAVSKPKARGKQRPEK